MKMTNPDNLIATKSFDFALKAIKVYKKLVSTGKEFVLSRQFLKSATSIGANIEEAFDVQSKKDFIAKLQKQNNYTLLTLNY